MIAQSTASSDFTERIVVDPKILTGKPVIRGTRIPVSLILNLIAFGGTFASIVEDYPILTEEDIRAAILYAGANLDSDLYALTAQP